MSTYAFQFGYEIGIAMAMDVQMAGDVSVSAGKTVRQLASQLRASAQADRRGSGRKPLPGRAHGEPDEFSLRSAARQEKMANYLDGLAARGQKVVTEEDVSKMLAMDI